MASGIKSKIRNQRLENSGAWKVSMCCLGLFFVLRLKTAEISGFQMYLLEESMWYERPQKWYLYPTCSLWTASQDCPRQQVIKKLYLNHLKLKYTTGGHNNGKIHL